MGTDQSCYYSYTLAVSQIAAAVAVEVRTPHPIHQLCTILFTSDCGIFFRSLAIVLLKCASHFCTLLFFFLFFRFHLYFLLFWSFSVFRGGEGTSGVLISLLCPADHKDRRSATACSTFEITRTAVLWVTESYMMGARSVYVPNGRTEGERDGSRYDS